jgi:hypothetical protein
MTPKSKTSVTPQRAVRRLLVSYAIESKPGAADQPQGKCRGLVFGCVQEATHTVCDGEAGFTSGTPQESSVTGPCESQKSEDIVGENTWSRGFAGSRYETRLNGPFCRSTKNLRSDSPNSLVYNTARTSRPCEDTSSAFEEIVCVASTVLVHNITRRLKLISQYEGQTTRHEFISDGWLVG